MKSQDFERLKAICEKEGFELVTESPKENDKFYVVKKKDKWAGVGFARLELDEDCFDDYTEFKIDRIDDVSIYTTSGSKYYKSSLQPSTEQAYVEQLKKEAFERFGEIKNGVSIKSLDDNIYAQWFAGAKFFYYSEFDQLYFQDCLIYLKGRWAELVKERVDVLFDGGNLQSRHFYFLYDKEAEKKMAEIGCFKVGQFIASQLEKYLNDEI